MIIPIPFDDHRNRFPQNHQIFPFPKFYWGQNSYDRNQKVLFDFKKGFRTNRFARQREVALAKFGSCSFHYPSICFRGRPKVKNYLQFECRVEKSNCLFT